LVRLVDWVVERRRPIAHAAILHSLLQLWILELRRIKGVEGRRVEHASASIGVEMVEACAIMVLDGGFVHPGAHVCGMEVRQPICRGDTTSAMLY
jgi:hypothetical protein